MRELIYFLITLISLPIKTSCDLSNFAFFLINHIISLSAFLTLYLIINLEI